MKEFLYLYSGGLFLYFSDILVLVKFNFTIIPSSAKITKCFFQNCIEFLGQVSCSDRTLEKKNVGINCTQTKFQGSFKKVSLINLCFNPCGRKMSDDFGSLVTATIALHTRKKLKNHT